MTVEKEYVSNHYTTEFESLNGRHETVVYKFTLTNNISF